MPLPPEEKGPGVPPYMVSFADMMTILLCFFILLCAFSQVRQAGLVAAGITSFREAIKHKGMPGILKGQRSTHKLNDKKIRFRAPNVAPANPEDWEPPPEHRPDNQMDALSAKPVDEFPEHDDFVLPSVVTFQAGSAKLPSDAQKKLDSVKQTLITHPGVIEISGHTATSEVPESRAYELSLKRAVAVMKLIAKMTGLGPDRLRPVGWADGQPASTSGNRAEDRRVSLRLLQ